jgi:hypothetical protein
VPTGSGTTGLAVQTGSVAVELTQIPNQPITFLVLFHLKLFDIYKIVIYVYFYIKGGSIAYGSI